MRKTHPIIDFIFSIKCLSSIVLFFSMLSAHASIIDGPTNVCIGNLAYFSSNQNNNVKTYNWQFGDGFTSLGKAPFHLYKKAGKFTVKLNLTLNDGSTLSDSVSIEVDELPKAEFNLASGNDSCLFTNLFVLNDNSSPSKPEYPISTRLVLWGDGAYKNYTSPKKGDTVQHHYALKDNYKIKVEITDSRGCKSSSVQYVRVIDGTKAIINTAINYPECGKAEVCFSNGSLTSNGNKQVYIWNFDSTGFKSLPYSDVTCITSTESKFVRAYLSLSNPDKTCLSEAFKNIYLDADTLVNEFILEDSVLCYGDLNSLRVRNIGNGTNFQYYVDNSSTSTKSPDYSWSPKALKLEPGMHTVSCEVSKGNCIKKFSATFRIKGPIAKMQIFNSKQCEIDKKVFFIDKSTNINPKNTLYNWEVLDPEGENCVIHRAKNQNKYKNCNTTKDWYGKHNYTIPRFKNPIQLIVTNTQENCSDTAYGSVEHFHCKLCDCRGGSVSICQYDTFLPLLTNEIGPIAFSLDTGKTWMPFPSIIPKPYKGWYGVTFIFRNEGEDQIEDFGDDSIKIYKRDSAWLDTIFAPDFLFVRETRSNEMNVKVLPSACNPFKVAVSIKDSLFFKDERVIIDWSDGFVETFSFDKDSIQLSFEHDYNLAGLDTIINITLISRDGCIGLKSLRVQFGKTIRLLRSGKPCKNEEYCFETQIINHSGLKSYNALKSTEWIFENVSEKSYNIKFCKKYTPNEKEITFISVDSMDCIDTTYAKVFIRELKAGVTQVSRVFFCSELKQLFDSSFHTSKTQFDYITDYYWDFGSSMFTTLEKDPFRSFEVKDSTIPITHIVKDNNGCRDTVKYDIRIIGSMPSFYIQDTVGCSPFTAIFKNTSKKCAAYIWEFDDYTNMTLATSDKNDEKFTYEKAGKFYPKLTGIDTFYNPYTGSVYYCNTQFDPGQAITVFDTYNSTFDTKDTICLGETSIFDSKSNSNFIRLEFGDGNKIFSNFPPKEFSYTYSSEGTYTAKMKPIVTFAPNQLQCIDSFSKTIVVLGVDADFEIEDKSAAPIFYFKNLSTPSDAALSWNFGQPSSGSNNYSSDQNPFHNYNLELGTFKVCLIASNSRSCKDTICKPIINDYVQSILLYNVFTPGSVDKMNDDYEVSIYGENTYYLRIYDRWGVLVYESKTDSEPGEGLNWNGHVFNNGNECPSGTYYYIFDYSFKMNPEKSYTVNGTISLIR